MFTLIIISETRFFPHLLSHAFKLSSFGYEKLTSKLVTNNQHRREHTNMLIVISDYDICYD
jgi:hypothetical protein